jgi:hypothetical protein
MNEEALIDAYNLFKRNGYGDSIEDFKVLISKNPEALRDSYSLFVSNGYGDSIDDYKKLLGVGVAPIVKKKSALDSSSEAGSLVSQESVKPQKQVAPLATQQQVAPLAPQKQVAPQVDGEPPVKPMQKLTKKDWGLEKMAEEKELPAWAQDIVKKEKEDIKKLKVSKALFKNANKNALKTESSLQDAYKKDPISPIFTVQPLIGTDGKPILQETKLEDIVGVPSKEKVEEEYKKLDLDNPNPYLSASTYSREPVDNVPINKDSFIEETFTDEKLIKLGIDPADFDGYLNLSGFKEDYKKRRDRGDFNPNLWSDSNKKLNEELYKSKLLSNYIETKNNREVLKSKLNSVIASYDGKKIPVNKNAKAFDNNLIAKYTEENLPILYQKLKERDQLNKEKYQELTQDNTGLNSLAIGTKNFLKSGLNGFMDAVNKTSTTLYDVLGAEDIAEDLRYLNEERQLERPSERQVSFASGKVVDFNGKKYLVDEKGTVYDKDNEIVVNDLIEENSLNKILEEAKKSKEEDWFFSPQGTAVQTSSVLGDMIWQVAYQATLGRVVKGYGNLPIPKTTADAIIAQSSLGYSQGYETALKEAREAGLTDKESEEIAADAAQRTAIWYGMTAPISPQTKAVESLFGSAEKELIKKAVSAYKTNGKKGFISTLNNGFKNIPKKAVGFIEEGGKEAIQENIQQAGESLWINAQKNIEAGKEISNETMSFDDFVNTSALSFLSGGIVSNLKIPSFSSNKKTQIKNLYQLSQDMDVLDANLKEMVGNKIISQEDADNVKKDVVAVSRNITRIPKDTNPDVQLDIMRKLNDIEDLENSKETLDKSFHSQIDDKIKEKRNEINEIYNKSLTKISEQPIAEYIIDNNKYTKEEFFNQLQGKTQDELKAMNIVVNNDEQTATEIGKLFEVPVQPITRVGETMEKESGLTPEERTQRISELNNLLASDATSLQETGTGNLIPEARQEIQQELQTLKAEQDAIQKQAAGQVPVQPTTRVGETMEEGKPQAEPEVTTKEGVKEEVTQTIISPKVVITGTRNGMENLESSNYDQKTDTKIKDARGREQEFGENNVLVEDDGKGNKVINVKADAIDSFGRAGFLQASVIVPADTDVDVDAVKQVVDSEVNRIKEKNNETLRLNEVDPRDLSLMRDAIVNAVKPAPTTEAAPTAPTVKVEGKIIPGSKAVISDIEITYPTEQEKTQREEERSTNEYINKISEDLNEEDVNVLKSELGGTFGLLSANNPMTEPLSEEDNAKLNEKAIDWLKKRGYNPRQITGKYGQGEKSLFVPKLKKQDAIDFAIEFNQESVAHSEGMIYQDGSMNPRVKSEDDFFFNEYTPGANNISIVKTPEGFKAFKVGYDFKTKNPPTASVQQEVEQLGNLISGTDAQIDQKSDNIKNKKLSNAVSKAAKSLSKILPNVKFVVHDTDESYRKSTDEEGRSQSSRGQYIQKGKTKTIHINGTKANNRTIAHEVFHAILLDRVQSEKQAADVTKRMIEAISKKIEANPELKKDLDDFAANYKENIQNEEKLAELVGILAENYQSQTQIVKDIIKRWLNKLSQMFGLSPITSETEVMEVLNTIARKVATGKAIKERQVAKVLGEKAESKISETKKKQAVTIMQGKESMKKFGLLPGKNVTRKIGEALQARQRSKYGMIDQKDNSLEAKKKISNWMVDEVKYFIELMGDKSGKGWYGELYQKSLDAMSNVFPEMKTDQNARDLFTMLVAITSDGQKVMSNFKLASAAYDYYKKNGKMPKTLPGQRVASFEANLNRINNLLKEYNGDVAAIKKDLMEVKSIEEINKERKKEGLEPLSTNWPVSFKAPFAASVFGPKLGMFYSNLSGNEAYPTLDRWWSRTFNRYRGTLIPGLKGGFNKKGEAIGLDRFKQLLGNKEMSNEEALLAAKSYRDSYAAKGYKSGTEIEKAANTIYKIAFENLNDAPFTKNDRQFMYDTVSDAVNKLKKQGYNLSIADVQAILWYFEKNLYKNLGVQAKIEGISYEDAANYTFDKWKESGKKFDYKINESEEGQSVEDADEDIEEDIISRKQVEFKARRQEPVAGNKLFNEPLQDATTIAERYAKKAGIDMQEVTPIRSLDKENSKAIAKEFDKMKDDPTDPQVAKSYKAMADETIEQYKEIIKDGYVVEINNEEPYSSSEDMINDLRKNKRFKVFSTESGFGDEPITDQQRKENPLLRDSGFKDVNGQTLLVNDVFRFVHDFFGHAKMGNSFGPVGEENAWLIHSVMYTPLARRAMTSETRGQNSWVNFSGVNDEAFKLRDKARELRKEGKTNEANELVGQVYDMMKFADQKIGLMPEWVSGTGNVESAINARKQKTSEIDNIVKTGKQNNFSDDAIRQYLKQQGYSDIEATNAINKYNVREEGVFIRSEENLGKKIKSSINSFRRRFLSARSFLPKSVFAYKEQKEAFVAAHLNIVDQNVTDFNRLYNKFIGDKDQLVKDFDAYLTGDNTVSLPIEFMLIANRMRNQIDTLSKMLIDNGLVDVEMANTIRKKLGKYLTRDYEIYHNDNWKDKVEEEVKQKAINLLRIQYLPMAQDAATKEGIPVNEVLDRYVNNRLDELLNKGGATNFIKGSRLGSKDLSVLKELQDIPYEIRALMGEYGDPALNYANTILKLSSLAANHNFLTQVKEAGMEKYFFEKNDPRRPKEFNTQIAVEGSETMNPLNGLYTTKEIAEAFQAQQKQLGDLMETFMKLQSIVRYGKTILSAGTHAKNVLGNLGFVWANGHYTDMDKAYSIVKNDLLKANNQEKREIMENYIRLGIVKQSAGIGEIMDMFKDANFNTAMASRLNNKKLNILGKAKRFLFQAKKFAEDLYQAEDDFFKIVAYENELRRYSKALFDKSKKDLTPKELEQVNKVVAEIVKNTYPTYSRIPEAIKMIRRFPFIGNFVSFQAEAYRTAFNTMALAKNEILSDNPEIRKIGAIRLAGATTYISAKTAVLQYFGMAVGTGLTGVFGYLFDNDDEEEKDKDIREFIAPWSKKSDLMVLSAGDGKIKYIDFSASDPHGGIKKAINAFLLGESTTDSFIDGVVGVLEPFIGEEMTTSTILSLKNNRDKNGNQIWNPEDTEAEKMNAILGEVYKLMEPGTASSIRRGIASEDKANELIANITGFRIYDVDVNKQFGFKVKDYSERIKDARRLYNSVLYKKESTEEDKKNALNKADNALKEIYGELSTVYNSAERLGVKPEDLKNLMKTFGDMGKDDITKIQSGKIPSLKQNIEQEKYKESLLIDKQSGVRYDNQNDLKRYNRDLWEKNFGEKSDYYKSKKGEREERKKLREEKDEEYDYTPKKKKNKDGSRKRKYNMYYDTRYEIRY